MRGLAIGILAAGAVLAQTPPGIGLGDAVVQSVPAGGEFFVQLSDPQFGFANDDKDSAQEAANAELAVATVNRLKPAFVVVTGDLVNKTGDAA